MVRLPKKSKHIDWSQGLKCDHRVLPWPWPWPWIFSVKNGICYIFAKNGLIATKRKANISIELYASNLTIRFDLGHDIDLEFSRSKLEFVIPQPKSGPIATKRKANISIKLQASNATHGFDLSHDIDIWFSRSNVTLTNWWPRPGIRIYQIATGVTSDVGMPSTHLVMLSGHVTVVIGKCCYGYGMLSIDHKRPADYSQTDDVYWMNGCSCTHVYHVGLRSNLGGIMIIIIKTLTYSPNSVNGFNALLGIDA